MNEKCPFVIPATFYTNKWKTMYIACSIQSYSLLNASVRITSRNSITFLRVFRKKSGKKYERMKHQFAINWIRLVLISRAFFFAPCKFHHKITTANYLNKAKFNNKIGGRARLIDWNGISKRAKEQRKNGIDEL